MFDSIHNQQVSTLYSLFMKARKEFIEMANEQSDYAEVFSKGGKESTRRPVLLYISSKNKAAWRKRFDKLKEARDALHEAAPEQFPLDATLMSLMPEERTGVTKVQMYLNSAVSSQKIKAIDLTKRVNKQLKLYDSLQDQDLHEPMIRKLKEELEYFHAHAGEVFRKRATGYTEVVALVYYAGDAEPEKVKVSDMGLFLSPHRGMVGKVKLLAPEEKPQLRTAGTKSKSIYDEVSPIKTVLPIGGDLYRESELDAARRHFRLRAKDHAHKKRGKNEEEIN